MPRNALVIIDVQNYFVNKHTRNLPKKIGNFVQKNKSKFNYVIFTKVVNKPDSNFVRQLRWKKCFKSPQIDIHPSLRKFAVNVFEKTSYSAFKSKSFINFLQMNKIKELYICGTDTESCVLATALEAFDLGYKVKVLKNLCGSHLGEIFHKAGITTIQKNLESNK